MRKKKLYGTRRVALATCSTRRYASDKLGTPCCSRYKGKHYDSDPSTRRGSYVARLIFWSTPNTSPCTGIGETRERERGGDRHGLPTADHTSPPSQFRAEGPTAPTISTHAHFWNTLTDRQRGRTSHRPGHEHITLDPPTLLTVDTCRFQTRASICTSGPCPNIRLDLPCRGSCARFAR